MISALKVSERDTLTSLLTWGLAFGGGLMVWVGVGMILGAQESPAALQSFRTGRLLFVAGGVCMVIGLLWRPRFCELYIRRGRFGFGAVARK